MGYKRRKRERWWPWNRRAGQSFRPSEKWDNSGRPKTQCPLQRCHSRNQIKTPLSVRFWNLVHIPLSPVPFLSQSHYHLPSPRDLVPIPNSVSMYQNIFSDLDLRSLCFYLPESNVLKKIKYFFTKVGCFFDRQLWIYVSHRHTILLLY